MFPIELNVTLGYAHFGRNYLCIVLPLGIPQTKPRTKFKVTSSSSFEDMFDRMRKTVGVT